jgi:type VI secretion system secreted protein VgrG
MSALMRDTDLLTFALELDDLDLPDLHINRVMGREAISRPFDFTIQAATTADVDPRGVIGMGATLVFLWEAEVVRRVRGIVVEAEEVYDVEGHHHVFHLAPRLQRATLVETLDVFMDMSVQDIVTTVLQRSGLVAGADVVFRLNATYPKREFVVQYKETDLAFVSRIIEHVGISYFFEQLDDREVVVFSDYNGAFRETPGQPHAAFLRRHDRDRGVYTLTARSKVTPSKYILRDYNYRNPKLDLTAEADLSSGNGGGVVEYGAHFKTPDEGKALASIRAEERLAAQRTLVGTGFLERLMPGSTFHLDGLPREEMNLLVVSVEHAYDTRSTVAGDGYATTFTSIETKTTYRTPRRTPKPTIGGVITAFVEADSSDDKYAKVDDQGRYTVRFIFDVTGPDGANASRPIRMAQPHAGPGFGFHFPLRGDTEVLVAFLDGDPDRPIISAAVPNPTTPSPVAQGNKARNIIRTGSGNEINLDDTKGSERMKLSSPYHGATIQLGSPNAPEAGIGVSALTNVSTVSGLTGNSASSLANSVSLFASGWGNHNINVAGLNNDYALVSLGVSELSNALTFSQSICDDITGVNTYVYTAKQNAAAETFNTYDNADKGLGDAINALSDLPACCLPPCPQATPPASPPATWASTLAADQAAYDAAQTAVQTGEGTIATDLANQSNAQAGNSYATASQGDLTVQSDWANLGPSSDDDFGQTGDKKTAYTLTPPSTPGGNPTPYYQARYNAKLQLDGDINTLRNYTPPASCTGCGNAVANLLAAYATYTSARSSNESAQEAAIQQNPADPRNSNYATNVNAANASAGISDANAMLSTVTGIALPIWSTYMTVTGAGMMAYAAGGCDLMRQDALGQFDGSAQITWADSADLKLVGALTGAKSTKAVKEPKLPHPSTVPGRIARQDWGGTALAPGIESMKQVLGAPLTPLFWKTDFWKESRQLIGSDEHAYFWGRKIAFVGGQETAVLHSRDKALVTGGDLVVVHSRGKTEVAGGEEVDITSAKLVDVASREKVTIAVTTDVPPATPPVPPTLLSSIALTNKTADHIVKAATSDGTMTLKIDDPANPLSIVLDQTAKSVTVDGGATGKITLKAGGWTLEIATAGITLSKGGTSVKLADAQIVAQSGPSKLTLASANAKLESGPTALTLAAAQGTLESGEGKLKVFAAGVTANPTFSGG